MSQPPIPDISEDDDDGAPTGGDDWDDDWDGLPAGFADQDFADDVADAEMARFVADVEAGRERIPEPWELAGPAVSISLGDAADVDPALLAAMIGPSGLAGESFGQDGAAEAMPPGPLLSALVEQAAGDLDTLTDNQVFGLLSGVRRLRNRSEYLEFRAIAEFARRRAAQLEAARAGKVPPGRRDGEFADSELAHELVTTRNAARGLMDMATDLNTRLPRALAGLGSGVIDGDRAYYIWLYTRSLSAADAAKADEILSAAAPDLRQDQLARKAAALEMKLDPEAARLRKEKAHREDGRVEVRREPSGNASLSGRELAIADVLSAKANVDALAVRLRRAGAPGTLRELRAQVYTLLLQGRDPLDGLFPADFPDAKAPATGDPAASEPVTSDPDASDHGYAYRGTPGEGHPSSGSRAGDGTDTDTDTDEPQYVYLGADDEDEADEGQGGAQDSGRAPGTPAAPLPALINFIVPIGTALGFSSAPGSVGSWGLTDPDDTRALLESMSRHPRTRQCVTVVGPDGTAIAHGCARGQHPWPSRPPPDTAPPDTAPPGTAPPDSGQRAAQVAELLRRLNVTLEPIARQACDHRHREDRYRPSRRLQHLVRARNLTCSAPGCDAQAVDSDLDHVVPYPDGPTCECNLHPGCRRHHRCKQAPGWRVEQPEPGVLRWTTPSGRSYTAGPTVYEAE